MRSIPIRDASGRTIGIACTRVPQAVCDTTGCTKPGQLLCDYPVKRRGRKTTCSRRMCRSCAQAFKVSGRRVDYCPPHAKVHAQAEAARAKDDWLTEHLAGFKPVKSDE